MLDLTLNQLGYVWVPKCEVRIRSKFFCLAHDDDIIDARGFQIQLAIGSNRTLRYCRYIYYCINYHQPGQTLVLNRSSWLSGETHETEIVTQSSHFDRKIESERGRDGQLIAPADQSCKGTNDKALGYVDCPKMQGRLIIMQHILANSFCRRITHRPLHDDQRERLQ